MLFEVLADRAGHERRGSSGAATHGIAVYAPEVDGPDLRVMPGDVDPADARRRRRARAGLHADGRRLGQGGGHYDRFLPRLRPDCVTIGACFAEQLVERLPTEATTSVSTTS